MASPVVFIMGVSGAGKSTLGKELARITGIPFFDADDFHPPGNIEKMKAGIPLGDKDRENWLLSINELARRQILQDGAIIACSALKEKYRQVLGALDGGPVFWIWLKGDYPTILERMRMRRDHYMPPELLQSQFNDLEPPRYALSIDAREPTTAQVSLVLKKLGWR